MNQFHVSSRYEPLIWRPILIALLLLTGLVSPAAADLLTWNLVGVTLEDGGSVTGSFSYDTLTSSITSWNIIPEAAPTKLGSLAWPVPPPDALSPAVSSVASSPGSVLWVVFSRLSWPAPGEAGQGTWIGLYLGGYDRASLAAPGMVIPLHTAQGPLEYYVAEYWATGSDSWFQASITDGIVAGDLSSVPVPPPPAVPLPPSAFLLGAGLMPMAWARRKKRLGK